jgi:hypothetical protein
VKNITIKDPFPFYLLSTEKYKKTPPACTEGDLNFA